MKHTLTPLHRTCLGVLACLVLLAGPACLSFTKKEPAVVPPEREAMTRGLIKVPNVYSYEKRQALLSLRNAGLTPVVKNRASFNFNLIGMQCKVLAQMPLPGDLVERGGEVTLTIYEPTGSCD